MKLVYTDIRNPLTQYLTDTAAEFAKEAKRVFTLLQTLYPLRWSARSWNICLNRQLLILS